MQWYYAEGQERKGPFAEEEFQRLVQQGVVTRQTLVWREGMANWEPYSGPPLPAPLVVPGSTSRENVTCTGCGGIFPKSEVVPLASGVYCATCKTAALQKLKEGVVSSTGAEEIRRQYLKHEASVKSIGSLYFVSGAIFTLVGIMAVVAVGSANARGLDAVPAMVLIALSAGLIAVGVGLRRLRKWARVPTGIFSGLGLLGFPIGTLINGYILYLVFSRKGRMVFSDEYQDVIAQTPHIKYRTSIVVWILLALLLVLFGFAFVGLFFARSAR